MNSIQEAIPRVVDIYNRQSSEIHRLAKQESTQQTLLENIDAVMRENLTIKIELAKAGIAALDCLGNSVILKNKFITHFQEKTRIVREEALQNYAKTFEAKYNVMEGGRPVLLTEEKRLELVMRFYFVIDQMIEKFVDEIPQEIDMEVFRNKFTRIAEENRMLYNQLHDSQATIYSRIVALETKQEELNLLRVKLCNPPLNSWIAVQDGDLPYLKQNCPIIKKKEFIDKQEATTQMTMLHYAAQLGQGEIANWLIKKNASLRMANVGGYFPIHLAAKYGHLEIVQALCKAGNFLDEKGKYDRTPLHIAAYNGHHQIVEWLINEGAPVNCQTTKRDGQQTALHQAVFKGHALVVAELTKLPQLKVQMPDANGHTPFYQAIFAGSVEIASLLMAHPGWKCPQLGEPCYAIFDLTPRNNPQEIQKLLSGLRSS